MNVISKILWKPWPRIQQTFEHLESYMFWMIWTKQNTGRHVRLCLASKNFAITLVGCIFEMVTVKSGARGSKKHWKYHRPFERNISPRSGEKNFWKSFRRIVTKLFWQNFSHPYFFAPRLFMIYMFMYCTCIWTYSCRYA